MAQHLTSEMTLMCYNDFPKCNVNVIEYVFVDDLLRWDLLRIISMFILNYIKYTLKSLNNSTLLCVMYYIIIILKDLFKINKLNAKT